MTTSTRMTRHRISQAAALALGLAAGSCAWAQEPAQRVEITGSAIKRIAAEGALPVQIFNRESIEQSGATSVSDLIQKLPAMQGFTIGDVAVGSNSGGYTTASLHDIGSSYTLVLLNGRRIAPIANGGVAVNLQSIPMAAIERVEVLTDGASALYGSDAIAGVINFVTKRSMSGGDVTVRFDKPQHAGGEGWNASVSYGFGDLDRDRFSLVATYRRDEQQGIWARDRDFSKTAYLQFSKDGKNYVYDRTSTSTVPANATVTFKTLTGEDPKSKLPSYSFNPYQKANGKCGPQNFYSLNNAVTASSVTENCAFDFVNTIEAFPSYTRDALYLSGQFKLTPAVTLFGDVSYTHFDLTARIAPNPVPVPVTVGSAQYNAYVLPYLNTNQVAHLNTVTASYRASDFGTRDSRSLTDAKHVVVGAEMDLGKWFVNTALTFSENFIDERYVGGYFKAAEFGSLRTSGAIDPFALAGQQTAATQQLIANSIFNGNIRTSKATLTGADVRATTDLLKLPAGSLSLALGADYREVAFRQAPSAAAKNGEIYNYAGVPTYDMSRNQGGAFAEVLVPVVKGLDVTGSARYDRISAIDNAGTTFGNTLSATTYKLSTRFQVAPNVLLRGSYGTGFKAPDMLDIAQPLVSNGVTASSYSCPFPDTDYCKPAGKAQYSQMSGGNAQLKPERSKQLTFGIRLEPTNDLSVGADYWEVRLRDAVSAVSANQAFADPQKYKNLFMLYRTPAETQDYWAFINASTNIGQVNNRGVDWDVTQRFATAWGKLALSLAGTYLIESSYTRPGTQADFTDSMSHYGENAAVSFRNILRANATFDTGRWTHSLTAKYRSGYDDIKQTVRDLSTNTNTTVQLHVGDYTLFDWQTTFKAMKSLELRLGVKNLLDRSPPMSLRDSSGHQVGYDPRYADVIGRQFYLQGSYKF